MTGTVQNPGGITGGYIANPGGAANTTTGSATTAGAAAVDAASNPSILNISTTIQQWLANFFSAAEATRWASVGIGGAFILIAIFALVVSNKQVQEVVKTAAVAA